MKKIETIMDELMTTKSEERWKRIENGEPEKTEKSERQEKYIQDLWNLSYRDKDLNRIITKDEKKPASWMLSAEETILDNPDEVPWDESITN